jgi:dTDP-4-amino-4,6-dideoxygalactose transaminase
MKNLIPYGKQFIDKRDIKSVTDTLKSSLITSGPQVLNFENLFKKKFKSKFAISCSNGTSALHLAFLSIGLKKGDVIIMPVVNFIASTNMACSLNAKIYFADIDPFTSQMSPQNLENCIKKNKLKKIKAVVCMHNGGEPNYFKEFYRLKKKYKFYLIEDACHSLGAKYSIKKKLFVGSCKYSDITTFSFHPVKNITTCEGGMVTTNNEKICRLIKLYRNHGIQRKNSSKNKYYWNYQVSAPGYNYRLSDVQSALGISQLNKIEKFMYKRKKIAEYYCKNLNNLKNFINLRIPNKDQLSGNHLFIISFKNINKTYRDKIISNLYKKNIITQVHYIPIYKFKYYKKICRGNFPGAEKYFNTSLSLPIYFSITSKQIKKVCNALRSLIYKND